MKRIQKRFPSFCFRQLVCSTLVLSSPLAVQSALAGGTDVVGVPLTPGISVTGALGTVTSGWADAMLPVMEFSPIAFWYVDPQGLYHNNDEYSGSAGTGFRVLTDSAGILGAYVFGDYNHSRQGKSFWFVSPGIERLGDTLDFSVNAYIPVSSRRVDTGTEFASDEGDFSSITFSGHDEFDQIIDEFESTGVGVDGEIGYRLPFLRNNTKLYVGGYYFAPKDTDSITGGTARLEVPITNFFSVSVSEAYDNIAHNTFKGAITLSLWGRSTHAVDHSLPTRMVDPIQRNRAAVEGSSHTSQYIAQGEEDGPQELLLSNIWFFAPGGVALPPPTSALGAATPVTIAMCTAEHPCASTDVNSDFFAGINAVAPNAKMFLAPGVYNNINGTLAVDGGQSMYGRTSDYKQSALGDNRALLIGGLDLFGNNWIDSLRLANDPVNPVSQGILLEDNAQAVTLNQISVGNSGSDPTGTYLTGILINSNDQISINYSDINAFTGTASDAAGIQANGSQNNIGIFSSAINATVTNGSAHTVRGIFNNGGSESVWEIVNSAITASSETGFAEGIFETGSDNQWFLTHNQLTASTNAASTLPGTPFSFGIFAINTSSRDIWNLSRNDLTVFSPAGSQNIQTFGSNTTWNLEENKLINSSNEFSQGGTGINSGGSHATWNLKDNLISVTSTSTDGGIDTAIFVSGTGTSWVLTGNTIVMSANGIGSSPTAIQDIGSSHSWNLTNNRIIMNANGGDAIGIGSFSSTSSWELANNFISATSTNGSPIAVLMHGANSTWELSGNTIEATSSGLGAPATGVAIAANNIHLTSTHDSLIVNASGSDTFGFSGNTVFGQATNSTINLINDQIQAISPASEDAYGVFDSALSGNHNVWNIDLQTISQIQVSGDSSSCKVFLGSCIVP